jgi:hypothetical protein
MDQITEKRHKERETGAYARHKALDVLLHRLSRPLLVRLEALVDRRHVALAVCPRLGHIDQPLLIPRGRAVAAGLQPGRGLRQRHDLEIELVTLPLHIVDAAHDLEQRLQVADLDLEGQGLVEVRDGSLDLGQLLGHACFHHGEEVVLVGAQRGLRLLKRLADCM